LETERPHFDGVSIMNSETFGQIRLFAIIFRPIGIVPIGIGELRRNDGELYFQEFLLFQDMNRMNFFHSLAI
jgi:hypothetical protein